MDKNNDLLDIILPSDILKKLQVNEGATIAAIETTDEIEFLTNDPSFQSGMIAYEKIAVKYANALQELAK